MFDTDYALLAELFDFPGPEYAFSARKALTSLEKTHPAAAAELREFLGGLPKLTQDLQELYTRTFDVQSITTLDIGYVLFGDDYKRAELLSNLTRENILAGTDRRGELADHLPNILRLMPKLKDKQLVEELVSEILVPALMLMIREFDPERVEKKNTLYQKRFKTLIESAPRGEPVLYNRALKTLLEVLVKDFGVSDRVATLSDWSSRPQTVDFLGLVEKEMEIEANANPVNSGCDS